MRWFLRINAWPREILPGLTSSIRAAYTPAELRDLITATPLAGGTVSCGPLGLTLAGAK